MGVVEDVVVLPGIHIVGALNLKLGGVDWDLGVRVVEHDLHHDAIVARLVLLLTLALVQQAALLLSGELVELVRKRKNDS